MFPDSKDFQIPYHELDRLPYEGKLRLGTYLQKNEDIYSVLFASCMRIDIIKEKYIEKCQEDEDQRALNKKEVKEVIENAIFKSQINAESDELQLAEENENPKVSPL